MKATLGNPLMMVTKDKPLMQATIGRIRIIGKVIIGNQTILTIGHPLIKAKPPTIGKDFSIGIMTTKGNPIGQQLGLMLLKTIIPQMLT